MTIASLALLLAVCISTSGRMTLRAAETREIARRAPAVELGSSAFTVVLNRKAFLGMDATTLSNVLDACGTLLHGGVEDILDAGTAYQAERGSVLADDLLSHPTAKARWLREWLSHRMQPGGTLVLVGDERSLPTWPVRLGTLRFTTDASYSDLDGDGMPDTAVTRIVGTPEQMIRQLRGKQNYGRRAIVLCSEDTRIHQETRAFVCTLARRGYEMAIRGARDDATLAASDVIVHFGHGDSTWLANRFGEAFVTAATVPHLPRAPVVFVDGCGTLPAGSPLLEAFLAQGAAAYCGSSATVLGMIPARFTNELVEHFLRSVADHPDWTLPRVLMAARAAYVRGHPGLDGAMRALAGRGEVQVNGESGMDLLTAVEWVYYGDPRATLPAVGAAREFSRRVVSIREPVRLEDPGAAWTASFSLEEKEGSPVLAVYAAVPVAERRTFQLVVRQGDQEVTSLDGNQDTLYQKPGADGRGGYVSRDSYQARYLVPLEPLMGEQTVTVRLAAGSAVELGEGTQIDVWPADFAEQIGLRRLPVSSGRLLGMPRPVPTTRTAETRLLQTSVPGYLALDLFALCNRPHDSMRLGGGDNASFKTWFAADEVVADGVPFRVRRGERDVVVSPDNTDNVFALVGVAQSARALHLLLWGYMHPISARLSIEFDDGSTQECEVPLSEWTQAVPPVAFDLENTVPSFHHAAILHRVVTLPHPARKIVVIRSRSGTFGLVAMTIEAAR